MNKADLEIYNDLTSSSWSAKDAESLSVTIKRYYTNVDGVIVDKTSVPDTLKTSYPYMLFNNFDKAGSYKNSFAFTPPQTGTFFIRQFTKGSAYDFTQFSGLNNLNNVIKQGDVIFLYADDALNPNYFIWVVLSVAQRSLNSIVEVTPKEGYRVKKLKFLADNLAAYNEKINVISQNYLGVSENDSFSPIAFKSVDFKTNTLITIPLKITFTDYRGLSSYFPFENDQISLDFIFNVNNC